MASRKNLLTVDYHDDTETGDHHVGEIDFGISGTLEEYIKTYGKKGVDAILLTLAFLGHQVQLKHIEFLESTQENAASTGEGS